MADIIKPFKVGCCANPYPTAYDETLSYYEEVCKIAYKLNEVINSQNILQVSFEQILEWVNTQLKTYTLEQLQAWLDDGTLAQLIQSILGTSFYFNTTEEMINDENLKVNDICYTLGFYSVNDKGNNEWLITNQQPDTFYVTLTNGLYAERINTGVSNVMQYGLQINQTAPNNTLIQQIFDENESVNFNEGTYYVSLASPYSINCHDNLTINGNGAMIKGIGTYASTHYTILGMTSNNVTVKNLILDGAKDIVTVTGEHGMCTTVGGENITFENVTFQNAFGDGAIVDKESKNISFINCVFDSCRRQGISITGCDGVYIRNCNIINIRGTAPEDGIDIEPYEDKDCKNIIIENTNISNCNGIGIQGYYRFMETKETGLSVNNVSIKSCSYGISISDINTTNNVINFRNIKLSGITGYYIKLNDVVSSKYQINFENIICENYTDNAVQIVSETAAIDGINFKNILFTRTMAPWTQVAFLFTPTVSISNVTIENTNARMFKNWYLVENLNIKNDPLYLNSDTTLTPETHYYSDIYVDSNITLTLNNFIGSNPVRKTAPMKIYILQNWNVILKSTALNKSSSIIGNNGTKISSPSGGANITIQGIRSLLCVTDYTGNWQANS